MQGLKGQGRDPWGKGGILRVGRWRAQTRAQLDRRVEGGHGAEGCYARVGQDVLLVDGLYPIGSMLGESSTPCQAEGSKPLSHCHLPSFTAITFCSNTRPDTLLVLGQAGLLFTQRHPQHV